VTAVSAPASTVQWTIRRVTAQTQLVDYTPNDPFPAETHEQALDRACMRDQELSEQVGRALTIPVTDPSSVVTELPSSVDRASKFFAFDANGNPTTAVGTSGDLTPVSGFMNGLLGAADAQSARDTLVAAGKPASDTAHTIALWSDASGNLKDGPALGNAGDVLTSNGAGADPSFQAPGQGSFRNLLFNGGFLVWQRRTSTSSFSTVAHIADRWKPFNPSGVANVVTAARDGTDVPTGALYALKMTGAANPSHKFGVLQVIETIATLPLRSRTHALSAKLKVSNARLGNIKMAILSWAGTADAPTYPASSTENSEGTDPTLAANWSYVNTPANLNVTTSWASYSVTGTIPVGANNVAVLIWCDDRSFNTNDYLSVADMQLEIGSAATAFERVPFEIELARCQRFYQKSFPYGTTPAQNAGLTGAEYTAATNQSSPITGMTPFKTVMRAAPTVTFYNPSAANALARNVTDGADVADAPTTVMTSDRGFVWGMTGGASDGASERIAVHWAAEAEI
jgi:hypothetical protein